MDTYLFGIYIDQQKTRTHVHTYIHVCLYMYAICMLYVCYAVSRKREKAIKPMDDLPALMIIVIESTYDMERAWETLV